MGKDSQNEKRSFLKTRLDGFVARLRKGSHKSNNATSVITETEESVVQSVVAAPLTHHGQKCKESIGLGRDLLTYDPKDHIEPVKPEKAISHIEKLTERISQLQIDIDNALNTHTSLEKEISNLVVANEKSTRKTSQRKQETDKLPVKKTTARGRREGSRKNGQKDDSDRAPKNKVRGKLCLRCKKMKRESDFHKDRSCKDGLARWCKECKTKTARKYRKKKTL